MSKREKIGLIAFLVILISILSFVYFSRNDHNSVEVISKDKIESPSENLPNNSQSSQSVKEIKNDIKVYICGEVKKPGVYTLLGGDRVDKLIELAGGFTDTADISSINLAMKLKDEDFIKIPLKGTVTQNTNVQNSNSVITVQKSNSLININTANIEELKSLPRIGDAIAQRIIDYREKNGLFDDIKKLTEVKGIGAKTFDDLKDKITVR